MLPPELEAAYRRTIYRAHLPEGDVDLSIGGPAAALERALAARGVGCWGWITAVNPRSRPLDAATNRERNAQLRELLADRGFQVVEGTALDPSGDWQPEPSFLVPGADVDVLVALGRRFEQLAIIVGERGGAPRLVAIGGARED